jgi:hypothetical protein
MALELRILRGVNSPEVRQKILSDLAVSSNDELARWARERLNDEGFEEPAGPSAKHASAVHGGAVLGDRERTLTANAFAVLGSDGFSPAARDAVAKGTVDEDIGLRPINHFYNPVTGLNTMPFRRETALQRCRRLWRLAVGLGRGLPSDDPLVAYKALGRSMHLLQDMSSPAHVHDDPHVPPFDRDDLELWGETHYPAPEDIVPGLARRS